MLTIRSEISPRQIRALLALLVLVPLIPTALMLRFMVAAVRSEQALTRERIGEVYQQALASSSGSLANFLKARNPSPRETPTAVVEFFQRLLSADVSVQLLDESGTRFAGEVAPPGEPIAEGNVIENFPGWKVLLFLKGPAVSSATEDQVSSYAWTVVSVTAANLCIAGLAAAGLHRRLRLNEMESSALATLAHELKTPVASMRVLVETLARQPEPAPRQTREYLQLMTHENERLARLLDHFLTLSRLDRPDSDSRREPVAPALLAREALAQFDARLRENGCEFQMSAEENLPAVLVNREQFVVALANLLDNALKYTDADNRRIALRVRGADGGVEFEVADNGIGIALGEQRKIFERFYQADQKLSRTREGCGLGLSIVKSIVEAHNGSVPVESVPGQGSTFRIRLPAVITQT